MKPCYSLLFGLLLMVSSLATAQTIRRVNNIGATGINCYATLQAAHDAASAGDILYVEPSAISYGDLNASKTLTIIGPGYYQPENTNATTLTSFDKRTAQAGIINFNSGSQTSSIMGMTISNRINAIANGIVVTRCYIGNGVYFGNVTSGLVSKCFFYTGSSNGYVDRYTGGGTGVTSGVVVQNCVLQAVRSLMNATITNNVISSYGPFSDLTGCAVENNILTGGSGTFAGFGQSSNLCTYCSTISYQYNVFCGTATPSGIADINNGGTNTTGVAYNSLFASTDPFYNYGPDNLFQLSAGSVARTAGRNGTQCGIFGGSSPYVLAGQPSVPILTQFDAGSSANSQVPLQVTISVRSNN